MDFQDLFADIPETIVVVSPDFKILAATNAYLKVTMRTRPEILGKIFLKEVYEDPSVSFEENPVIQSISRAIANQKVDFLDVLRYDLEKPAAEGGGYEERYWEASHTPVLDETGQLKYVIQKTTDVTERELAKKEKEQSEEKFRFIADAVPQLIYTADENGRINYVNQRWLNYTGLSAAELAGTPWPAVLHPDNLPEFTTQLSRAIADFTEFQAEIRIRNQTGKYRWHLLKSMPMLDAAGQIVMRIGSTTDIHDTKLMVEELLASNEQMAQLSDQVQIAYTRAEAQRKTLETLINRAPAFFAIVKGPDHRFELINQEYQKLFPGRELVNKTVVEVLPEVVEQGFVQLLDQVYQSGKDYVATEIPVLISQPADDTRKEIFVNFVYQAMYDNENKVEGILVFGYEVTEQVHYRRKSQELHNSI